MKRTSLLAAILLSFTFSSQAQSWSHAGTWVNSSIECLKSYNGTLYVGGNFTGVGTMSWNCSFSAMWDGTTLSPYYDSNLGGLDFSCFAVHNSTLFTGGAFQIGSFGASEVAEWTGTAWDDPTGAYALNSNVYALQSFGGNLYAGGYFTTYNSTNYNHIAVNNGSGYSTVGSGFDASVFALTVYNGSLYAGGGFTNSGATAVNHIAKWNGSSWQPLGTGVNGTVKGMAVMGTDLYVIGSFTQAGSVAVNNIAKWNGTAWSDVGGGITNVLNGVRSILSYNNYIYVGGDFTKAGNVTVQNVAAWNGSSWSALGSGVPNMVNALEIFNNTLYAGPFAFANDTNWVWKFSSLGGVNETEIENSISVFPNPSNGNFILTSEITKGEITIYNVQEEKVYSSTVNRKQETVNLSASNGIYFLQLKTENGIVNKKIIINK
ncbi:MAG: T9SS type A sorting domain-containing protein [Bacteroidetes bacterium]|nr:T9SS type A sorting domain-containing protein [Bacteroidota bacterium]